MHRRHTTPINNMQQHRCVVVYAITIFMYSLSGNLTLKTMYLNSLSKIWFPKQRSGLAIVTTSDACRVYILYCTWTIHTICKQVSAPEQDVCLTNDWYIKMRVWSQNLHLAVSFLPGLPGRPLCGTQLWHSHTACTQSHSMYTVTQHVHGNPHCSNYNRAMWQCAVGETLWWRWNWWWKCSRWYISDVPETWQWC